MIRITDSNIQQFEIDHEKKVRTLGSECTLLLKSNGLLPLKKLKKVALFGGGARHTVKGGTGSGDVNVRHFVTIEEGIENAGIEIVSKKWLDEYDDILNKARKQFVRRIKTEAAQAGVPVIMYAMGKTMPEPDYEIDLKYDVDTAVYVLSRNSGEGADREITAGDILLSETEIRDIKYLNENYKQFVLILNVGGFVDLTPVQKVDNILLLGQLGQETGNILADLLTGKNYPSGKLAMTWAPISNYPTTQGFGAFNDTEYNEGIYVGYRYFDTVESEILYPFGFGLSYTEFEITQKDISVRDNKIILKCQVKNIGEFAGKEVVQVYYSAPDGKLDKPYQELIAYRKTKELMPNESETMEIIFNICDMASYDSERASYILEKGKYIIRVGNSSRNTSVEAILSLSRTVTVSKHKNICNGLTFKDKIFLRSLEDDLAQKKELELNPDKIETYYHSYEAETVTETMESFDITWNEVKKQPQKIDEFAAALSDEQLTYLALGHFEEEGGMGSIVGAAAESVAGAAGETTSKLKEFGVPTLVMADGPAGIRVCREYKVVDGKAKGLDNPLAGIMDFLDEDTLKMMSSSNEPTQEEMNIPVNYTYCTAVPIGTDIAQTWNDTLAEEIGDLVGKEMEMFGINLWLAPALNIQRSPLCGRNFEYYSEDPLISGRIAAAITRGVQSHKECGTTIKHFACNNQETNRMRSNSVLSERALREIYLRGFEIAVKESQPKALMTSYNLINGEHSCNSRDLITHTLRDEWGYKGGVMTDWYATSTIMSGNESMYKYPAGSAAGCIYAGNDLIMPAMLTDKEDILNSIDNSEAKYPIKRVQLQMTAKRILKMILNLTDI